MLDILCEAGVLRRRQHCWYLDQPFRAVPEDEVLCELPVARTWKPELEILQQCGKVLPDVLRGSVTPMRVLFSPDGLERLDEYYRVSPPSAVLNTLTRQVTTTIEAAGYFKPLRILELGAGTGATTEQLLSVLNAASTEYTFTDVSRFFLARAARRLAAYSFVRYAVLDVDIEPSRQGYVAGGYDVIIATNVLHATMRLRTSLQHVRQLLAPGGLFILREGTQPQRRLDLTFGLLDGWWRFADGDVRPSYPLVSAGTWLRLLREQGFEIVVHMPAVNMPALPYQTLFVAGVSAEESGRYPC
jgi:SAM-dependent methyltransferase